MVNIFSKSLFFLGILIASLIIFFDLFTKDQVFYLLHDFRGSNYAVKTQIKLTEFFSLVYVNNNGISFGMFSETENAREIFAFLQGSIATILIVWLWRIKVKHLAIAVGLIIGGAFGNVIDRIQNGGVTDFLDFHIASYHWPAFNLADSAIFIGVAIVLFDEFIIKKK
jgi:signal peptidase II